MNHTGTPILTAAPFGTEMQIILFNNSIEGRYEF